ncbi:phage portal protein, partial [Enterococcus faecium]
RDSFILNYATSFYEVIRIAVVVDFSRFYEEIGGVLFQEPGVTSEEMNRNFEATDIIITEEITGERIANVYNVPTIFLNSESSSFS